jgi:hypothetical protein
MNGETIERLGLTWVRLRLRDRFTAELLRGLGSSVPRSRARLAELLAGAAVSIVVESLAALDPDDLARILDAARSGLAPRESPRCRICPIVFASAEALAAHVAEAHPPRSGHRPIEPR